MTECGPAISERDIEAFEVRHGIKLPASYKSFLLVHNGGQPERDLIPVSGCAANPIARIHFFFGINILPECYDLSWNLWVFSDRIPHEMMAIATTEGADQICMKIRGSHHGSILYWDGYIEEGVRLFSLAENFDSFLNMLYKDSKTM